MIKRRFGLEPIKSYARGGKPSNKKARKYKKRINKYEDKLADENISERKRKRYERKLNKSQDRYADAVFNIIDSSKRDLLDKGVVIDTRDYDAIDRLEDSANRYFDDADGVLTRDGYVAGFESPQSRISQLQSDAMLSQLGSQAQTAANIKERRHTDKLGRNSLASVNAANRNYMRQKEREGMKMLTDRVNSYKEIGIDPETGASIGAVVLAPKDQERKRISDSVSADLDRGRAEVWLKNRKPSKPIIVADLPYLGFSGQTGKRFVDRSALLSEDQVNRNLTRNLRARAEEVIAGMPQDPHNYKYVVPNFENEYHNEEPKTIHNMRIVSPVTTPNDSLGVRTDSVVVVPDSVVSHTDSIPASGDSISVRRDTVGYRRPVVRNKQEARNILMQIKDTLNNYGS